MEVINLFKVPWLGSQFERLIGVTKQALNKSLGGTNLHWNALEKILLYVEINVNNGPLTYTKRKNNTQF